MKLQMLAMQECSPSTHFICRHRRRRTYEDTHSLVHRKQQKKLCREFELRREIENMQHSSFRTQYNNSNECAARRHETRSTQSMSEQQSLMKNDE